MNWMDKMKTSLQLKICLITAVFMLAAGCAPYVHLDPSMRMYQVGMYPVVEFGTAYDINMPYNYGKDPYGLYYGPQYGKTYGIFLVPPRKPYCYR